MSKEKEYIRFITDPLMEPYFIAMDSHCMTVNVKVIPDSRYTDSNKEYIKVVGHYHNLSSALEKIIKEKVNNKSYDSLKEYIESYKYVTNEIKESIKI